MERLCGVSVQKVSVENFYRGSTEGLWMVPGESTQMVYVESVCRGSSTQSLVQREAQQSEAGPECLESPRILGSCL